MTRVALLGIILQVFGLYIAVTGVVETYSEAFDRKLWTDFRTDVKEWIRKTIFRRPPIHKREATGGGLTGEFSDHAADHNSPQRPAPDAQHGVKIDYLLRYTEILSNRIAAEQNERNRQVKEVEVRLTKRVDSIAELQDKTERAINQTRDALFGINGIGIRKAAVGLLMTVLGTLLSLAGLSC